MKTTGFRSMALYLLLILFLGGLGVLCVRLVADGKRWVAQPYNGHIYAQDATADTGQVLDRNNILLAYTQEGKRLYSDSLSIRRGLLHTVGDSSGYIGTSVQAAQRSKLMGYNLFTGLNRTPITALGGNNVKLTVDASLSATAYNALNGLDGAVLVYNYQTGEVLCKVSAPSYDPMDVPQGLVDDPAYAGVFVDNTLASAFVPGSIFKLVTAASAMEKLADWNDRTYECTGAVELGGSSITCLGYHGTIDMQQALGESCNVYFALLANDLGGAALQATGESMGFNQNFHFPDFSTAKSDLNLEKVNANQLGWAAVGQHTVTANPMHMLLLMGAIAQGGEATPPHITPVGLLGQAQNSKERLLSSSTAASLKTMMRTSVSTYYGDWLFPDMEVCAKTGTAEVDGETPTSWIVGFSDKDTSPYAFVVAVKEGGSGIGAAGNIASLLMQQLG